MKGLIFVGGQNAIQAAGHDRQPGEFSESEIAARQAKVPRTGMLAQMVAVLHAAWERGAHLAAAPHRA